MARIIFQILALSLLVAGVASAEDQVQSSTAKQPERISFLATFGDEKCPEASSPDEIVVCATAPEGDRYRIPKNLRSGDEEPATSQSWASAVQVLDEQARPTRPNSCSVVGSGGFTGCTQAMLRQWFAERRAAAAR